MMIDDTSDGHLFVAYYKPLVNFIMQKLLASGGGTVVIVVARVVL